MFDWFGLLKTVFIYLISLSFPLMGFAQSSEVDQYRLGSGDAIKILIYGEDDLTVEARLGDSGKLNYPFLGELVVSGFTVGELQGRIHQGLLGDYLVEPKVSVSVTEYRQFFINGQVESPGGYSFQPGLTVGKAVSLASGFSERANKRAIYVVSDNDNNVEKKRSRVSLNTPVKPGDVITVEQSFF